jgi:hypothetical protein
MKLVNFILYHEIIIALFQIVKGCPECVTFQAVIGV